MTYRYHGRTDTGLVRAKNEDAFLVDGMRLVFAVADGVGGLPGGAEAAMAAVESVAAAAVRTPAGTPVDLPSLFLEANRAVVEVGRRMFHEYNTGTTLTAAQIVGTRLSFAHLGDSNLHLIRGGRGRRLNEEHTVASDHAFRDMLGRNYTAPMVKHVLTRCLGASELPKVNTGTENLLEGDWVLLGTDGIFKGLELEEIVRWIEPATAPADLTSRIIKTVNRRGGFDNSTAVAIKVER